MITKKAIRDMRLEVLEKTLNRLDIEPEVEDGVWEGVIFNIGKLLLEHLEDHSELGENSE